VGIFIPLQKVEGKPMNRQFPALRGLAIAIVVLHHAIRMGVLAGKEVGIPPARDWQYTVLLVLLQLGIFAVPTFLFISGGFFAYTAQGENPKLSYKTVWAGLRHLLWPYVFWSLVFYLMIYLGQGKTFPPLEYVKNLIVGYPFNFVPLIAFFYLVSPVLVRLSKRFGWAVIAGLAVYQLVLFNLIYPGALGFQFPEAMKFIAPPVIRTTLADWGLFFPLGVIYSLKARSANPGLLKLRWLFWILTVIFYATSILDAAGAIRFPLANFLAPLAFVLAIPSIRRDAIPLVRQFEKVGKKAYGLYLTNLIVLFILLVFVKALLPDTLRYMVFLLPFLFALGLCIPLFVMNHLERAPVRKAYPYVFG
jgi:peptidoglycan/LPS O-acetylase OafA/YrhL